jgi:hypothetical protein
MYQSRMRLVTPTQIVEGIPSLLNDPSMGLLAASLLILLHQGT